MSVHFRRTDNKASEALGEVARSLAGESIPLRELLERLGEHGLLMTCLCLAMPFLVPVSIPGVSIAFGLVIVLIALGLATDRLPWLPQRLLGRRLPCVRLAVVLERAARLFFRIERFTRPRLLPLTSRSVVARLNGLALLVSGLMLMMPLGIVPLTNTLPALAVVLLSTGIMQRDGFLVLGGYLALLATLVYFAVLASGAWVAGAGLRTLFTGG
ncbi:MAG: exopolysaccharide biosynthesis protein [Planctomycetota bacterium]